MHSSRCSILVGLVVAAGSTLVSTLQAIAAPTVFKTVSGKESTILVEEGLSLLEEAGLIFSGVTQTAPPSEGYTYGFDVAPSPATDSSFSVDFETGESTFLTGRDQLLGSIFFEVDTNKLNLDPILELGNFLINFDETAIVDTVSLGLPILKVFSEPAPIVDFVNQTLEVDGVDLRISQEFNDYLLAAGSKIDLTGTPLVLGRLDRTFRRVDAPTSVPEPTSLVAVLFGAGSLVLNGKRHRRRLQASTRPNAA